LNSLDPLEMKVSRETQKLLMRLKGDRALGRVGML